MEILLAVVLTYITITYIFPLLDLLIEIATYRASESATKIQVRTQTIAKEFELKYPDYEQKEPLIGFQYEPIEEYEDEDDDDHLEPEDYCKGKIGFTMKK